MQRNSSRSSSGKSRTMSLMSFISNFSIHNHHFSPKKRKDKHLRPCQERYMADNKSRRLSHRALSVPQLEPQQDEPIFVAHEANLSIGHEWSMSRAPKAASGYSDVVLGGETQEKQVRMLRKEKHALLSSLNSARVLEGRAKLELDDVLGDKLQQDANCMPGTGADRSSNLYASSAQRTSITPIVQIDGGTDSARRISPPGLGSLACAEMWCGGKYRAHTIELAADRVHPDGCPCHLRLVWECMVEPEWKTIGIAKSKDGKWVVELVAAPPPETLGEASYARSEQVLLPPRPEVGRYNTERKALPALPLRFDPTPPVSPPVSPLTSEVESPARITRMSSWETISTDRAYMPQPLSVQRRLRYEGPMARIWSSPVIGRAR